MGCKQPRSNQNSLPVMKSTVSCLTLATVVGALVLTACGNRDANSAPKTEALAEQTPEQKFASTLKAAERGDAEAQYNLGSMYWNGEGVTKDLATAVEWYRKSAEQGSREAQLNLGWIYAYDYGFPTNTAEAAKWFRKAADQGDTEAQFHLGRMYENGAGVTQDLVQAANWYRKAAEGGGSDAQFNLGSMYAEGVGVTKDLTVAVEWYRKSAEQGSIKAQFNLGWMYASGDGVSKDLTKAFEWWKRAAEQGHESAQHNLGLMYANGTGVEKDEVLAYAWLNIAAVKGRSDSVSSRDMLEQKMTKQQLQEAQQLSSQWSKRQSIVRSGSSHLDTTAQSGTSTVQQKRGTGTVFVVSKAGHAVTNHHVVQGCTELRVEGRDGIAKLVTDDKVNDLALLQIPGQITATAPIAKEPQKIRQGEEVVVFGFPLNFVLSSGGNLTPGLISALTGLGNNTNQFQITAPIQPGSSGSPLLNKKGEVVGAVVMKLSDKEMAKATGSIGQNVNFAVSGQTLKTFLDTHKVDYRTTGLMSFDKSTADIADEARKWTTVVECWR